MIKRIQVIIYTKLASPIMRTKCNVVLIKLNLSLIFQVLQYRETNTGGLSWGPYRAAARSPQHKNSVFSLLNLRFIYKCRPNLIERPCLVGLSRSAGGNKHHI
jgi:hypothetical protein